MSIDLQNAFALSRSEYRPVCQQKQLEDHLRDGKFVIGYVHESCCPFTDAVLGYETVVDSVYDTLEEAEAAFEDDGFTFLSTPDDLGPVVCYEDDPVDHGPGECPF